MASESDFARKDEAFRLYQAGNVAAAEQLCRELLRQEPPLAEAVYLLSVIAQDTGHLQSARNLLQRTVQLAPDNAVFVNALGEVELSLGNSATATECFQRAVHLRPGYERGHNNLGRVRHSAGDLDAARSSFAEAVRLNPRYAIAHNNLGAVLQAQGQHESAASCFRRAIAEKPDYPEAHFNLGTAIQTQGDPASAVTHFQRAIQLRPGYARAHFQLAQALELLRQDFAALAAYQQAVRLDPDNADHHQRLGDLLLVKGDCKEALVALERAVELQPDRPHSFARLCYGRQLACDWRTYQADCDRLWRDAEQALNQGKSTTLSPFQALTLPWSNERLFRIAKAHCAAAVSDLTERGFPQRSWPKGCGKVDRIKIGYVSGDFYDHAISHLICGLFERHDRNRFEVFAYGFGKADQSVFRRRIIEGCEHFVDVSALSVPALADRITADEIHIVVDLMGHTGINRLSAIALKPAPIQVNFLGMLGTIGGDFIDYLITDPTVTSADFAPYFCEQFVTMPHCYLIAEPEAFFPAVPVDRTQYGLPATGFVFCSFNSAYKHEPRMFSTWMQILTQVPDSVLWLFSTGEAVDENLRREAGVRGVSPDRLVFASSMPRDQHLLRHRAADLFLDGLHYNAAATASLALQMALPVLSTKGQTFGSRIGASLLTTVGLPELIADDLDQYAAIAVRLAQNPDELASIRERLVGARKTSPLFDTPRFVRNLERAFQTMWDTYAAGNSPRPIVVRED